MAHANTAMILNYHRIYSQEESKALERSSANFYSVPVESFRQQLSVLRQRGFRSLLLDEFMAPTTLPQFGNLVITFDDGNDSDLHLAVPLLQEFGFRAVFFVCIEYIGKPGYLSWEKIKALLTAGMSVQSHGLLHHDLTQVPFVELVDELEAARVCLERNLDRKIRFLAIPGGFLDRRICTAALEAGYDAVCSSVPKVARAGQLLNRISIRHSLSRRDFEAVIDGHPLSILKPYLAYRGAGCLKRLVGVGRYESLKVRLWP